MPRVRNALATTTAAALLASACASVAPAQQQQAAIVDEGGNPAAPSGSREANQGVYVRDSAVAAERLALGERMERLKEWDKAADVFQEILEKYPDRVVQSTAPGQGFQYSSVALAVQQRLAKWPTDGLRAYRNRYESTAAELLASATVRDDYATLNNVFQRYFVTDAGKRAALRLIDLYLEGGEFPAAAWLGDRLLQWHPSAAPDKPAVLYRVSVAYHLSGDKEKAKARLDELKQSAPDATGTVRGQDVNLAESLAKDLSAPVAIAQSRSADSWPTFMGDPSRGRVSTGLGRAGARPFSSITLQRPPLAHASPDARQEWENAEKLDRERGLNIGIIPSVDRGEMFFQDGARVYAVSLDSGTALPGWAATYPGTHHFTSNAALAMLSGRQQYTVSVTDREVLAVVGQSSARVNPFAAQMGGMRGSGGTETRLVCLDRTTGKERWSKSPKDFPEQGNVRSLALGGSPLVVGDNVYVCGTGGKAQQFDDCYVFCLDRATGQHKWSAYVCSAATGAVLWGGGDGVPAGDVVASTAYASGRLYVLTNLGAVAALDAYSGSIVWLNLYERDQVDDPRAARFGGFSAAAAQLQKPWAYNPTIVSGGRVFSLPADGKHLAVYDAGTGDLLKKIPLADLDNADTLVGVQGNRVVVTSDANVYAFDWTKYQPGNFAPENDPMLWRSPLKTSPVRGRAFLTADSVFVPTKERLFRIALAGGKIQDHYPPLPRGGWEDPEGPGNVVVTDDKVVIAGPRRLSVYTDLAVARARLDQQVAAAPKDPDLRLRYAEMMFVAGDLKAAMAKLDEAVEIQGGAKNLAAGPDRDRTFHTALTFAQKLTEPKAYSPDSRPAVDRLFDQAAAAAQSASQHVEYRLARARFAHATREFPAEVRLYQEILADEAMRTVTLGGQQAGAPQQAGAMAEAAVAALIRQSGPEVYAPYERAARDAMDFARSAQNPGELLAIAHKFPNAGVAPASMFHAAAAYEAARDHRRATQVLRQLYFKYPQSPDRIAVLEAMARNYLAIPGHVDVAASRLTQGARLAGQTKLTRPLTLPDGKTLQNVTLADAAGALKRLQAETVVRSLPQFGLPAAGRPAPGRPLVKPLTPTTPVPDVTALVQPLREFTRNDRAVVYTADNHVAVVAPGASPQPLWRSKTLDPAPRQCAWLGGAGGSDALAVWNQHEIALLNAETGAPLWRSAVKALPGIEVVQSDAEDPSVAASPPQVGGDGAGNGQQVVIINGRRVAIPRGAAGQVRFFGGANVVINGAVQPPDAAPDPAAGEQIVHVRPAGDRLIASTTTGRVFAVDAATGRLAWQTRLADNRSIERLLATDDFAVARFTDGAVVQIVALDAATGQVVRRYDHFRLDQGIIPINQALSPDGTLVIAMPDRLLAKDLYEPGPANKWETPAAPNGAALYLGAEHPDQLLAQDGRVVIVSDTGSFVRVVSLDTGEPARSRGEAGEIPVQLPTGARANTSVRLRLAGSSLYVFGPTSLKAYDLDHPLDASGQRTLPENANLRDLFVGSDYVIAVDEPGVARFIGNPDAPAQSARLLAYSRARVNNRESGRLDHDPTVSDTPGITAWHPATGGLFYHTTDNRLHFLKANASQ